MSSASPNLPVSSDAHDIAIYVSSMSKSKSKDKRHGQHLDAHLPTASTRVSAAFSEHSLSNSSESGSQELLGEARTRYSRLSPSPGRKWRDQFAFAAQRLWIKNKGLILVIISQLFGVMMNVTIRLLEVDDSDGAALHPFQVPNVEINRDLDGPNGLV